MEELQQRTQLLGGGSDVKAPDLVAEYYWKHPATCNDRPHFIQVFTMMQPHRPLLCFISLHISNGSVSTLLVGHVLYSADLMSATCIPHSLLMVHRYIYSRYSPVFLMLYQLYHSLSSSTLNTSSSLYLSVAT